VKILHIIPSFYPASSYGGAIESAYRVCQHLARLGHDVRVLTTNADGREKVLAVETNRDVSLDGVRVCYTPRRAGDSVAPGLLRLLPGYVAWADVVHVTAVYSFPVIPALVTCRLLARSSVWSPRGALQRWAGTRRVGIKRTWENLCWSVRPRQLVLHFTSAMERSESMPRCPPVPAVVVPNGVDVPATVMRVPGRGTLRLLFLGRLDPKKGIENLVSACVLLSRSAEMPWALTIAGSGDEMYVRTLRERLRETGVAERIAMPGHVSGAEKTALFEAADVVVFPSHTENFGMVVAEALAHGIPVIASRATPWERLEEIGCGLWVPNDSASLAAAIQRIARMPRGEMGVRGRRWMKEEFSWGARAAEIAEVYADLTPANPRPRSHASRTARTIR
jgi:glycosyltransferase involved in cell wall biosynthesis